MSQREDMETEVGTGMDDRKEKFNRNRPGRKWRGPIDKKKDRYMDKQKQNSGDESTDQLEQTCSAFWRLELASETQ